MPPCINPTHGTLNLYVGLRILTTVLGIRIRRVPMFLSLPYPNLDPLVRGTDPDPDSSR
jgi:hypothetical protein